MSNNGARSAVGKNCASTELAGINPDPPLKSVRVLPLTSTEPRFSAVDSWCQFRPTEDLPHSTAMGSSFQRKKWIHVWPWGGGPKHANHHRAWMSEIQEEKFLTSLLLHHYSRKNQGNTLLKTSSSPFPKLFAQDSWHRQPRSLPGFPW